MVSYFIFNGKNSSEFKIGIEQCRTYPAAARSVERQTIPGRAGELLRDTGTYANVIQPYEIYFNGKVGGMTAAASKIVQWLMSGRGYCRLEDSYEPDCYRMASYAGPFDAANWMNLYGRATIEFDCMPQRWLKSGETPVSITSGQTLQNDWQPALPLIRLTGTGDGELTVGGSTITITGMDGNLTIDSDTQNAYDGTTNKNSIITVSGGFPVLATGETIVSFSGGITAVQITPRWWRL